MSEAGEQFKTVSTIRYFVTISQCAGKPLCKRLLQLGLASADHTSRRDITLCAGGILSYSVAAEVRHPQVAGRIDQNLMRKLLVLAYGILRSGKRFQADYA